MSRPATEDARRARRSFWILVLTAIGAMGVLSQVLDADPAPGAGLMLLLSPLVMLTSVVQASRIWVALEGPARLPRLRRWRWLVLQEGKPTSAAPAPRSNRPGRL